jgi:hypothetical protein
MKKVFYPLFLFCLLSLNVFGQKDVFLTITHKLGANPFAFNQTAQNSLGHSFQITRVDYYISGLIIVHDGGIETPVPNHYILAKGSAPVIDSLGSFNVTNVEGIKFSIGVEAPTNTSDPTVYSLPHPLALQAPSMHWGWSSGYRFVCLEGMSGTSLGTVFQMHGLFDANYFAQTQMAAGMTQNGNIYINLNADYIKAVNGVNLNAGPVDHGVDQTDLNVLENFRDLVFSPGTSIPNKLDNWAEETGILIFPNPSNGQVYVDVSKTTKPLSEVRVLDVTGKEIQHHTLIDQSTLSLNIQQPGMYFLQFSQYGVVVGTQKVLIQ